MAGRDEGNHAGTVLVARGIRPASITAFLILSSPTSSDRSHYGRRFFLRRIADFSLVPDAEFVASSHESAGEANCRWSRKSEFRGTATLSGQNPNPKYRRRQYLQPQFAISRDWRWCVPWFDEIAATLVSAGPRGQFPHETWVEFRADETVARSTWRTRCR
jgi:hypothetical protein